MSTEFQLKRRERRERLQHLLAHRDDRGEWSIYGDWLEHEGDPRGALINLMLARELNPTRELVAAEKSVLAERPAWLMPDRSLAGTWHAWWRGFLREVDMLARSNPAVDLAQLAQHPSAQLLQYLAVAPSSADRKECLRHVTMLPVRSLRIADAADEADVASASIDLTELIASPHLSHLVVACTFDFTPTDWTRAKSLTELTLTHATARATARILDAPPPGLTELRLVNALEPDEIVEALVTSQRWAKLELVALHDSVVNASTARRLASSARPPRVVLQARAASDWDPTALEALRRVPGIVCEQLEKSELRFLVLDSPRAPVGGLAVRSAMLQIAGRTLGVCQLDGLEDGARLCEQTGAPRAARFEVSAVRKECSATHFALGRALEREPGSENIWSLVQSELDALLGFDPGAGIYSRLMQALVEAPASGAR